MTDKEKRILEMLRNVRNFASTHGALFPPGSLGRELFDKIGAIVGELENLAVSQSSGRATVRLYTAGKAAARTAILGALTIISRTARAMSINTPGLEGKFRIPHKMNDQVLLDTARAFLADAQPYKAEFLRYEVTQEFFDELSENILFFDGTLVGQYEGGESSATAGASFDAKIESAMNHLRQLDPIVRNKLRNDPAGLAAWERARHIERAARRNNHDTPPDPPDEGNSSPPAADGENNT
jgi:hypothetical protein